ncbi:MAG: protein-methionine-sulfoxide reductase catalytic subunit MsrP [Alphaproteobacteria bacterium]
MWVRRKRGWEIPERDVTPETAYLNRRTLLGGLAGSLAAAGLPQSAAAAPDPSAGLYPAERNTTYTVARDMTPESVTSTYNNFYEFGSHKKIYRAAAALEPRPWTVRIDGAVENGAVMDIDTLLSKVSLEERVYRHRCVEAWAMTVPWTGFPLSQIVRMAKPLGSAKYVRMETFLDPKIAPGQRAPWYPWPYVEVLTIEEAMNDLAFMATGVYGKPLAPQFGTPLRLAVPWKYGFKSIKSIVRFTFEEKRSKTFWESIQPKEYGFWANVNPEVRHPRWSQASERLIGTGDRVPTRLFNGYGAFVADLYADKMDQKIFF